MPLDEVEKEQSLKQDENFQHFFAKGLVLAMWWGCGNKSPKNSSATYFCGDDMMMAFLANATLHWTNQAPLSPRLELSFLAPVEPYAVENDFRVAPVPHQGVYSVQSTRTDPVEMLAVGCFG
ncbi:hypothetical protein TSMEX_009911 [Taenia solium]|eukprot:TsM_000301500 transcript=TsM_000301500 gene=TsM_000301500